MKDLISIIVPVYNTEKYLERCLLSLVNQTHKNLEILLIDDGSTDRSGEICDEWAKRDKRIKVFHKDNGGQCTARNLGLEVANGKYIAFVDSDDYVDTIMYEALLSDITTYETDVATCRESPGHETTGTNEIRVLSGDEIMLAHLGHLDGVKGVGHSPCEKLYSARLFNEFRFANMRAYEDCASMFRILAKCRKLVSRNRTFYHYISRENSTMSQTFSAVKFCQIDAYWLMYQHYREQYPQYAHIVKSLLVGSCQYCIGESYKLKRWKELHSEIGQAQNKLRNIDSSGLSLKLRVARILMITAPDLFGWVYSKVK